MGVETLDDAAVDGGLVRLMTLTPDDRKAIGDAFGALAGAAVDACKSHHDCHCERVTDSTSSSPRIGPNEATNVTVTNVQRCDDSGTGDTHSIYVEYPATTITTLAFPLLHYVEPGRAISASATNSDMDITQTPAATTKIKVQLPAGAEPGLYMGRLLPANGGLPDVPVLIFVDGMA